MRPHALLLAALLGGIAAPALAQEAATATMTDASGAVLGTLSLMEADDGVHITGALTGVPNGEHGFHIHETGACDAVGDFASAGAHFEPGDHQHGHENPQGPHAGDLMNVVADDDGNAIIDLHNANVTLSAGEAASRTPTARPSCCTPTRTTTRPTPRQFRRPSPVA